MASMFSPLADRPTSDPSKYHWKVPAVFVPNEVGTNRTISESSTLPTLGIVHGLRKLKRILPSVMSRKASTSVPAAALRLTSDPSKYRDQIFVAESNFRISSDANATPPTVPAEVELR